MNDQAGRRKWRNQPLVRERDERRMRRLWRRLLWIVVALAPTGAYLHSQNECLKLSYAVDALRAEQHQLLERQRELIVERDQLAGFDRIERWADKYGMIQPTPEQVTVVRATTADRGNLLARGPDTD